MVDCKLVVSSMDAVPVPTSIRRLELGWNDFSDLSDLTQIVELPALETLGMAFCKLTSASVNALSKIEICGSLRNLCLNFNHFSDPVDFSFVTKLASLEKLDMRECKLKSASINTLSGINAHNSLRELNLCQNDLSDLLDFSFITRLPSLNKLNVSSCKLTPASLATLHTQTHGYLMELDLSCNDLSGFVDLSFITGLPSLMVLSVRGYGLGPGSLSTLPEAKNLRELILESNDLSGLSDFSFITRLASLNKLSVSSCKLTPASMGILAEIEIHNSLTELDLNINDFSDLSDFSFIAKLPSLNRLCMSCCGLTPASLRALADIEIHSSLATLELKWSKLSGPLDFTFITRLTSLSWLDISGSKLTSESGDKVSELCKRYTVVT